MTNVDPQRLPTRATAVADVPDIDAASLPPAVREALAELLLSMADDEFVIGFWDSEWTGIAPTLEEDVAFSSLAQDEIGHARVWYEMHAALTGGDADHTAFGRQPHEYRHASLLDHPRGDWASSVARRYLYDTADAVRLAALRDASFRPLADVVAKVRREERYHLLHVDAWVRRLAAAGGEARSRLEAALARLWPDARSVLSPLAHEAVLLDEGILAEPLSTLSDRWARDVRAVLVDELRLDLPGTLRIPERGGGGDAFRWLWSEFTSVHRSEPGATW